MYRLSYNLKCQNTNAIENISVEEAKSQLDASEVFSGLGGRGHARRKHAELSFEELKNRQNFEGLYNVTAYLTKEDQDRALASAIKSLRQILPPGGTVRGIQRAHRVKTDLIPILIAGPGGVKLGWSSSMTIIRDPGIRNNNIVTAYPLPDI